MTFNCLECNWTGDGGERVRIGNRDYCPLCSGEVVQDDRDPDPLDEHNADYVRDGLQAVRGQL